MAKFVGAVNRFSYQSPKILCNGCATVLRRDPHALAPLHSGFVRLIEDVV